jgi:uncharacterized protein (DUF1810 family)
MPAIDAFDLERFVEAPSGVYGHAVADLRSGQILGQSVRTVAVKY